MAEGNYCEIRGLGNALVIVKRSCDRKRKCSERTQCSVRRGWEGPARDQTESCCDLKWTLTPGNHGKAGKSVQKKATLSMSAFSDFTHKNKSVYSGT